MKRQSDPRGQPSDLRVRRGSSPDVQEVKGLGDTFRCIDRNAVQGHEEPFQRMKMVEREPAVLECRKRSADSVYTQFLQDRRWFPPNEAADGMGTGDGLVMIAAHNSPALPGSIFSAQIKLIVDGARILEV